MDAEHARESALGAPERRGGAENGWEGLAVVPQVWPGMLWLNPWVELWTSMWAGWLGRGLSWQLSEVWSPGKPGPQRGETPPRLPTAETAIIPLHRHADSPRPQAHRISMRLEIPDPPWVGGNVIAMDAVVLRSRQKGCPAGDGGPDRGM